MTLFSQWLVHWCPRPRENHDLTQQWCRQDHPRNRGNAPADRRNDDVSASRVNEWNEKSLKSKKEKKLKMASADESEYVTLERNELKKRQSEQ